MHTYMHVPDTRIHKHTDMVGTNGISYVLWAAERGLCRGSLCKKGCAGTLFPSPPPRWRQRCLAYRRSCASRAWWGGTKRVHITCVYTYIRIYDGVYLKDTHRSHACSNLLKSVESINIKTRTISDPEWTKAGNEATFVFIHIYICAIPVSDSWPCAHLVIDTAGHLAPNHEY